MQILRLIPISSDYNHVGEVTVKPLNFLWLLTGKFYYPLKNVKLNGEQLFCSRQNIRKHTNGEYFFVSENELESTQIHQYQQQQNK